MSLRDCFGPSKKEIWKKLCNEIEATFVDGGFWGGDKVVAKVNKWAVTLDTYTVSTGRISITYTRMRAPYVNKDGFQFKFYRKSIFSDLGKLFGMQDIEVGIPFFDEKYIVQGNNIQKVKEFFSNTRIYELVKMQPDIYFKVKDDEGIFGLEFPRGVDELYLEVVGVIKDIERLKSLFELFSEIMNQLCLMGSAYQDNPGVELK